MEILLWVLSAIIGAFFGFMLTKKELNDTPDHELIAILKERRFKRALLVQTSKDVDKELENEMA